MIATLPDEVAAIAIRDTLRGRRVVVPGVINKLIVLVMHFIPLGWKMRILEWDYQGIGVDTESDLERIRDYINRK